jgi:heterodisulfide reductase subunit A
MEKCIACGQCADKCPKKVDDTYNESLIKRKAIYVPYSQAVPLKYAIDPKNCIYLTKGKCRACEKICPSGAINFDEREKNITLQVGSIILAPGFKSFDPGAHDNYAYATHPNVVTSLEFERILSATGPFSGHLVKPSDKSHEMQPKKIAWIQCVGSRDMNQCDHGYCSSVCCMYAVKQSLMAKDHSPDPLDCAVFYMDIRTQGKDFDRYYENAQKNGVRFIRSRIHSVSPVMGSDGLALRYVEEKGPVKEETFDMVVLSTGLEMDQDVVKLSKRIGIDLDHYRFVKSDCFHPVTTSVKGIYACGAFTGPKDIPQSVMEASAAACVATERLASVRNTQTHHVESPAEKNVSRERPRIGVFVCNCGINIGGVINVPEVVEYARTLPHVAYVEENLFTCSQDAQEKLAQVIREKDLNRVVIAACSPRTHEGLFQETLSNAGLNKYLLEMANIRNHDSWVHSEHPDAATDKAKDLVRMTVAKTALLCPLVETELPINRSALVVGGGIAGMTASLCLANHGFPVDLVESSDVLGGNAKKLNQTYMGDPVIPLLENIIDEVHGEDNITVHLNTTVGNVEGFVGNFKTKLVGPSSDTTIAHGAAILATGAKEYQTKEYLFGKNDAVLSQLELDKLLRDQDPGIEKASDVAFIQCVGSRDQTHPYCSKVCCTHSIKNALALKKRNPEVNVYVFYRDIRTYGKREDLYREARARGVFFFRYSLDEKPVVKPDGNRLQVMFKDHVLGSKMTVSVDILCLATAIESNTDPGLIQSFKVPVDGDGWLLEAHQKLRPVDFANEGVFLCGMAHYPKPIEESIAQAQAAASRALTCLAMENIKVGGLVSDIDPRLCSGCLACINVCPYGAISFNEKQKVAEVNPALCKGCGACAAACPSEAPVLRGFDNRQLLAQINSALAA